ncbi:MAG: helix-turn-helix domain-containing protein [Rhizobiaceae bacterium]|nr:helix-turn-helix domain-containing protein [Rhizobiaceae bacterium]
MANQVPNYRLYREERGETGDFWLHCETIPERTSLHNFEIALHRHDTLFQIFLLTAGSGEVTGSDEVASIEAPCALLVPPDAAHGFSFARDVDGLVITALADKLKAVAAGDRRVAEFAARMRAIQLASDTGEAAAQALKAIETELASPAAGRLAMLEALMAQAIVGLARAAIANDPQASQASGARAQRIDDLMALVGAHYRQHRPVTFYAERLGITPTHLNRIARSETGLSVQGLLTQRLIEAAQRDLVFSPSPVNKIAYSLGFADPAYFNRFFRRAVGTTPGAFRAAELRRLAL